MITVGLGLCFLNRIRARFGRYGRWAASVDGHRYNAIQRDMETAAAAFTWVAAEKRAAEEREKRARDARDRHYLLTLSPRDFERHIGGLFAALGYAVQLTAASHDEGIDAFLKKDGRRALVQCKRLKKIIQRRSPRFAASTSSAPPAPAPCRTSPTPSATPAESARTPGRLHPVMPEQGPDLLHVVMLRVDPVATPRRRSWGWSPG